MSDSPRDLEETVRAWRYAAAWLKGQGGRHRWCGNRLDDLLNGLHLGGGPLAVLGLDGLESFEPRKLVRERRLREIFELYPGGLCHRAREILRDADRLGSRPLRPGDGPRERALVALRENSGPGSKWPVGLSTLLGEFQKLGLGSGISKAEDAFEQEA